MDARDDFPTVRQERFPARWDSNRRGPKGISLVVAEPCVEVATAGAVDEMCDTVADEASIHVRREALTTRMEVGDLRRRAVAAGRCS